MSPARLATGRGSAWLDGLPLTAAVETCEVAGAVAAFGRDVRIRHQSDDAWHTAGDVGFAIASDGAAGIDELLSHLDRTYDRTRSATEGPQALYGTFYKWLYEANGRPDLDAVRGLLIEHVVKTSPVGPSDVILGRSVPRRAIHSVYSAAIEYGIHPKRLRKIVFATGLADPAKAGEPDERVLFDAVRGKETLERAASSLSDGPKATSTPGASKPSFCWTPG